jgi:hypothetical protein
VLGAAAASPELLQPQGKAVQPTLPTLLPVALVPRQAAEPAVPAMEACPRTVVLATAALPLVVLATVVLATVVLATAALALAVLPLAALLLAVLALAALALAALRLAVRAARSVELPAAAAWRECAPVFRVRRPARRRFRAQLSFPISVPK